MLEGEHADYSEELAERSVEPARLLSVIDIEAVVGKALKASFEADVSLRQPYISITTRHLWATICFLFMRDLWAGKNAVCENPDCKNPYFIKVRSSQKFCNEVCANYGHKRDALKYWNNKGKKRRNRK